jgi:tetratricopeptide (TPR) repeat protein
MVNMADAAEVPMMNELPKKDLERLCAEVERGSVVAMIDLVWLYREHDRPREAERWCRRVIEAGSLVDEMLDLTALLDAEDRWDEAETWLLTALEENAGDSQLILERLGAVVEHLGRPADAERWLERAIAAGSDDAMVSLAKLLERQGRDDEAEHWLHAALESRSVSVHRALADMLMRQDRTAEAEHRYEIARKQERTAWGSGHAEAAKLRGKKDLPRLRAEAEGGSVDAMRDLVWLYEEYDRPREAERWCHRAIDAGSLDAMLDLAGLLEHQGRDDEAETWLVTSLEENAGYPGPIFECLGTVVERLGRPADAERWLHAAIDAGSGSAHRALADMLMRQDRTAEAERRYEIAREREIRVLGSLPATTAVVMAAATTAAVVPFIQTLATKAAEDSYAAARGVIRRLIRQHGTKQREPITTTSSPVLRVTDPDSQVVLELRSDVTDEALEALAELDLGAAVTLRVAWKDQLRRWEVLKAEAEAEGEEG